VTLWTVSAKPVGAALELGKAEKLFELPIPTPGSAL
jgi:hypothetical protein